MLCRIVSSFDGTVRYRFAQLAVHDPRPVHTSPGKLDDSSDLKRHSAAGTTARKVPLSSPCFFLFQSGTRAHTPTRPRSSGNGTVPGAQGCTTLGTGSLRGSTAADFFTRRWDHTHATETVGDRCSRETIFRDGIGDERESSSFEPRLEDIYIPRALSVFRDNFPSRGRVPRTKSLVMRNLNGSTTTCSFGRMPGFPPQTRLSQQIRAARSTDPAVLAGVHIPAISRHATVYPQDALLLVLRRIRRIRGIRIMLPSSAYWSVAVYYFPSADTRRE